MGPEYRVTFGQLSVWRDVERMPPDRTWEANLTASWRVPPGVSADEVWVAVRGLAERHESLRTVYDLAAGRMRQRVLPAADIMDAVRRGEIDAAARAELEAGELRRAFDLAAEPSWRAWLTSADGRPDELFLVIHHIAADGTAMNVAERDFRTLLAHGRPGPAPQPRQLAAEQRSARQAAALEVAGAYWRRILTDAAPATASPVPRGEVIRADLHTGIPADAARRIADRHRVSLPSLLLAVYAQSLADSFKLDRPLLYTMSSNRVQPAYADLVSSLNQWVPVLFDAGGRSFPQRAASLHWRSFKALKYGCYDPDAITAIKAGLERDGIPPAPGWHYTFLPEPPGARSAARWTAPSVEWVTPGRGSGPSFYMVASTHPAVTLRLRAIRADVRRKEFAAFLDILAERVSAVFTPDP